MTDEELAHFGVKGMRWGVRKPDEPTHASYTKRMQDNDQKQHGKRAVKRINRHLNEGSTRDKALAKEDRRNVYQRLALIGGIYAVSFLAEHGAGRIDNAANYVGNKAKANRSAAKFAEKTAKISSNASKLKYVKPKGGVHKITTMK